MSADGLAVWGSDFETSADGVLTVPVYELGEYSVRADPLWGAAWRQGTGSARVVQGRTRVTFVLQPVSGW